MLSPSPLNAADTDVPRDCMHEQQLLLLDRQAGLRFGLGTLEQDFVAHLRLDQRRAVLACAAVLAVLWLLFVAGDLLRLRPWRPDMVLPPGAALMLALRGVALLALGLGVWTARHVHLARWIGATAALTLLIMAGNTALAVVVYRRAGLSAVPEGLFLMVMAPFFPVGLLVHQALAVALAMAALATAVGAALLPAPQVPDHLRLCAVLALTALVAGLGGYLRERSLRAQYLLRGVLSHQAGHCPLTGLCNRRWLQEHLDEVRRQARRTGVAVGFVLVDVDYFKRYNDRHGHPAGDLALQRVAACLAAHARRPLDVAARLGGEEFGLLLYDCGNATRLQAHVQALCDAVLAMQLPHDDSPVGPWLTVSAGAVVVDPDEDWTSCYHRADLLLYQAKQQGRNRGLLAPAAQQLAEPAH